MYTFFNIIINIGEKGSIDYISHNTNDEYSKGIKVLTENYNNNNVIN